MSILGLTCFEFGLYLGGKPFISLLDEGVYDSRFEVHHLVSCLRWLLDNGIEEFIVIIFPIFGFLLILFVLSLLAICKVELEDRVSVLKFLIECPDIFHWRELRRRSTSLAFLWLGHDSHHQLLTSIWWVASLIHRLVLSKTKLNRLTGISLVKENQLTILTWLILTWLFLTWLLTLLVRLISI